MEIRSRNWNSLYRLALRNLVSHPDSVVSPRGQKTHEIRGAHLVLLEPRRNLLWSPARKLNYRFMVAEYLWMLLGQNDKDSISKFNLNIGQFSDDGVAFMGAYGPKLADQLPYVVQTLKADPSSRQAVMTIWRERPGPSKDVPCTALMQFMIRNNALEMVTYMRSNDAFLGMPYDVYNFTMIQAYVAELLGLENLGPYHHMVGSLHLYDPHLGQAEEITAELLDPDLFRSSQWFDTSFRPAQVTPALRAWYNRVAALEEATDTEVLDLCVQMRAELPRPWHDAIMLLVGRTNPVADQFIQDPALRARVLS